MRTVNPGTYRAVPSFVELIRLKVIFFLNDATRYSYSVPVNSLSTSRSFADLNPRDLCATKVFAALGATNQFALIGVRGIANGTCCAADQVVKAAA
jgi:hypothetical protein